MPNTLRTPISYASAAFLLGCIGMPGVVAANPNDFGCSDAEAAQSTRSVPATNLCLSGEKLTLEYQRKGRKVTLHVQGHPIVIEQFDKGYGPELIDMQGYVRFLPLAIQPYLANKIVLFNSVVRSTGGNGSGQCGSGYELFLNALKLSQSKPRVVGKVKIGSCTESIFPEGIDEGPADYSAYSVRDGKLIIKFFNYKSMDGSPTAALSKDFKQLEFTQSSD